MKTKPIVPWMGGKRRLVSQLIEKMPEHQCYVELFAGGAALFFMREQPSKVEIINDVNGELVNLYRVVQHHLEEFIRHFKWAIISRQMFEWLKAASTDLMTDIQRAARFYYLQHTAFGGKNTGQAFGTATTAKAPSFLRIEDHLTDAYYRLSGVTVENLSWDECLMKYDRPHSFMYADPPYWKLAGYGMEFGWEHYRNMAELMKSCQSKIMLSINDHPDIRGLFADFNISTTKINYSVGQVGASREQKHELIITNY